MHQQIIELKIQVEASVENAGGGKACISYRITYFAQLKMYNNVNALSMFISGDLKMQL